MINFEKKTVVVLGAARQGLALARYAARHGAHVIITDQKAEEQLGTAMESVKSVTAKMRMVLSFLMSL